jgi:Tfp pilus assembly protein PilF
MKKFIILMLIIPVLFCFNCRKKEVNTVPNYLKPGSPEHLMNDGFLSLNAGDLVQAEKNFLQALRKRPNLFNALYALGIVYLKRADIDRAEKYFVRTLQVKPDYIDAHNYLGIIYTETGKYQPAKEHLLIAANSPKYETPENAFANLARLELKYNKYKSARRYVEKGLVKNIEFAPLLNYLGIILENEKNYTEAIFNYEKAIAKQVDVTYLINIGRVYKKIGQKDKALDVLEQALSKANSIQQKNRIREMMKGLN